jgi:transcriptional regulator with XRE-family HTH domain
MAGDAYRAARKTPPEMQLGRAAKLLRERWGLTQAEVAGKAGISEASIRRLESDTGGCTFDTAYRVSVAFGIGLDTMIGMGR